MIFFFLLQQMVLFWPNNFVVSLMYEEIVVSIMYEELTEIYTCKCRWYIWYVSFMSCVLHSLLKLYVYVDIV